MADATQVGNRHVGDDLRKTEAVTALTAPVMAVSAPVSGFSRAASLRGNAAILNLVWLARNDVSDGVGVIGGVRTSAATMNLTPVRIRPVMTWQRLVAELPATGQVGNRRDCGAQIDDLIDAVNATLGVRNTTSGDARYLTLIREASTNASSGLNVAAQRIRTVFGRPGTGDELLSRAVQTAFQSDWAQEDARASEIAAVVNRLLPATQRGTRVEAELKSFLEQLAYYQWEARFTQRAENGTRTTIDLIRRTEAAYGASAGRGDVAGLLGSYQSGTCQLSTSLSDALRGAVTGAVNYVSRYQAAQK